MMRIRETKAYDCEPVFLGYGWIQNWISEYRKGNRKLVPLKGRHIIFPERHFAAALMHLYVGTFSLSEIADIVSVPPAELAFLRTEIDFVTLVDRFKAAFARYFRENLMLNEYPPMSYVFIAAEYAAFEELARNQIRVPLFKHMKQLGDTISDKERHHLSIDLYDLRTFKKLFSFFVFEECFLQALAKPCMPKLKRIAKEIVWKGLHEDYNELHSLLSAQLTRRDVKDELRTRLGFLKIH
jgi:hypothetical protein